MPDIVFSRVTTFLGRNGMFKATGVSIGHSWDNGERTVMLEPVTSKDTIGRCWIEMPEKDIPKLITELQRIITPKGEGDAHTPHAGPLGG